MQDFKDLRKPSERKYGRYDSIGEDNRCVASVSDGMRFANYYQCKHKNGFGPNSLYCKLHSPETKERKEKEADAKFKKRMRNWHIERAGFAYHKWAKEILATNPEGAQWDTLREIYLSVEKE